MPNSLYILVLISLFITLPSSSQSGNSDNSLHPEKPNLIVIMTDDLGYEDVGFNGCQDIPTPNIDRIAKNGVKFTNGYTSYAVCGPSRAGFITGRYGQRFGFERNPQYKTDDPVMGLPQNEKTIAEHLKTVGYTSGIIGKWHLGAHKSNHPLNRGFDEFFGHLGGGHTYFPQNLVIKDSYFTGEEVMIPSENDPSKSYKGSAEMASYRTWIMRNHDPVKTTKYLTDEFSEEAVRFIERNKKEPFFLFLSYNAPHNPLQATQEYLDRFSHIENDKRKTYAAMVSAVDDGVGKVLDKLEALNLDKNTIVVFLSDNGGPESKNASNNGVLREGKGSIYEGGFRVPFAIQWKGQLKEGTYDYPVSSLDILGTIAPLAGVAMNNEKPLDGVNLIPYLNESKKGAPHQNIFIRKFDSKVYSVRDGALKLIVKKKTNVKELYNLNNDISEKSNIARENQNEVERLSAILNAWETELIDPLFLGLIHTKSWQKKRERKNK
ncbi:sulfatase-like hydrolase/transferase [Lutimonas saemankumensis]|uniref:sulfatase-like hydrolase/transferase n=1 Tax=Lutimonas saemankumensis TaxID=483016 RepID=UPI001CD1B6FE|nr:sulfatase-like hydrolase/transferase [Lutimonas saemankumensis]MCA0932467.1 sulfatase-like hydrolase/transferase [Lutimonas saemankumensis]